MQPSGQQQHLNDPYQLEVSQMDTPISLLHGRNMIHMAKRYLVDFMIE